MDFEALLGMGGEVADERLLREKVRGLDGAEARRVGDEGVAGRQAARCR